MDRVSLACCERAAAQATVALWGTATSARGHERGTRTSRNSSTPGTSYFFGACQIAPKSMAMDPVVAPEKAATTVARTLSSKVQTS